MEIPAVESPWQKKEDPAKQARMLGIVRQGLEGRAVLARFLNCQFQKFQFKDYGVLRDEWNEVAVTGLPGWRELARLC